jgi:ferric-dicitrate binding protein FerR (iron transport regulator)
VHETRAWAASQAERMAQVLQGSVAPKVSALLSSAAQRLEPAKPRRRPWRKLAAIAVLAAAASAAAALVLNRRKPEATTSAADADADGVTPAAQMRDGQARTSGRVRTS